jgi:uncharacterized tellurite resistance protein B-like protein
MMIKLKDILGLVSQGNGSASSHMKNLIEVAAVDGQFLDVEMNLLKTIAKRHGISDSRLQEIRKNPGAIKFEIPTGKQEKFSQLFDLVHMMSVDDQVHEEEWKLCNLFAIKFGYERSRVEELIESVKSNIQNGQSLSETMKRVEWMLG